MDKLLTQKDLAERWQVSVRAVEQWRKEGVLQPAEGVPAIRFHPDYIARLEGVELTPVSPLRLKKLERELDQVKSENEELRAVLSRVLAEASRAITRREASG